MDEKEELKGEVGGGVKAKGVGTCGENVEIKE